MVKKLTEAQLKQLQRANADKVISQLDDFCRRLGSFCWYDNEAGKVNDGFIVRFFYNVEELRAEYHGTRGAQYALSQLDALLKMLAKVKPLLAQRIEIEQELEQTEKK